MGLASRGERVSRIPWANGGNKAHLRRQIRQGEPRPIRRLDGEGSVARGVYQSLDPNRAVIKSVFFALGGNGRGQVVFAGIVRGTCFKFFGREGNALPIQCPSCRRANSFSHLQQHGMSTVRMLRL